MQKQEKPAESARCRQTLASVSGTGDHAATLRVLRDRLAGEIDRAWQPRDIAVLSARLMDVLAQLEAVRAPSESKVDELAGKRAARRAAAGGSAAADS